jgi:N-dimethylarginine dimethylaminohydrolase
LLAVVRGEWNPQECMTKSRYLMCPPDYFGVEYVINPWMAGQLHAADQPLAAKQWRSLCSVISNLASVVLMPAVPKLPDLVFTANAALIFRQTAVLSSFRCVERQPEAAHYAGWLRAAGFDVRTLPEGALFEGAGDSLLDRGSQPLLWSGYGYRSNLEALPRLEEYIGVEVQPLRLCDPRFYHLDTCFCPLDGGHLLYYPGAFDEQGNAAIEARVPPARRLAVPENEATLFTCNAVNIGRKVILNDASEGTQAWLRARGFEVIKTHTSEFMKAGGSAKCLSLLLDEF